MTVDGMIDRIKEIIQDDSLSNESILDDLNAVLLEAASAVRLPPLITSDDVTFLNTEDRADLPDDFLSDVFYARNTTSPRDVAIYRHSNTLRSQYPEIFAGVISGVSEEGLSLVARPIASGDQVVRISYYGKPAPMELAGEVPDCIPSHLHEPALVAGALHRRYQLIEDGIDGAKAQTEFYGNKYIDGIMRLRAFYPNAPRPRYARPAHPRSRYM